MKGDKGKGRRRHGLSKTPEHNVWCTMRQRCVNPKDKRYPHYGGRGIKVCERWNVFENFYADMGRRPGKGFSIDRIDNDGDYCPENCRWATQKEQCNNTRFNKRVDINGELLTLTQVAEQAGLDADLVNDRLRRGCPVDLLTKPVGTIRWRPPRARAQNGRYR